MMTNRVPRPYEAGTLSWGRSRSHLPHLLHHTQIMLCSFFSCMHSFLLIFLPGMTGTSSTLDSYNFLIICLFQRGRLTVLQPSLGAGYISIWRFLFRPLRSQSGRIPSILPGRVSSISFLLPSQSAHIFISPALLHHHCLTLLASRQNSLMAGAMPHNRCYPLAPNWCSVNCRRSVFTYWIP